MWIRQACQTIPTKWLIQNRLFITRIVEIIQNNDLENKKENIRVRISNVENEVEQRTSRDNSAFKVNGEN